MRVRLDAGDEGAERVVDAFAGATVGADPFGTEEIGAGLLRRASGGSPAD